MSAPFAALHLDDVLVESLHMRTDVRGQPTTNSDEPPAVDVELDIVQSHDEQARFMIPFTVRLNHRTADFKRLRYSLDLKLLGFFSFDPGVDTHEIDHLIGLNAPSLLYGVARGIVAQSLSLTHAGRVILPSVNFVEIMRERERKLARRKRIPDARMDEEQASSGGAQP